MMNNKQKMYLGVFILAVIVLGIMYSMGTFSKSSLMSFNDSGAVVMRPNIMSANSTSIGRLGGRIGTNETNIGLHGGRIGTNETNIGSNVTNISNKASKLSVADITSQMTDKASTEEVIAAIDGAKQLAAADRNAIKNFVRSKAVLFNPANYNKEGQVIIGNLINKEITAPVLGNDIVF